MSKLSAFLTLLLLTLPVVAQTPTKPWPIKVVIVTTFEPSPEAGWQRGQPMGEFREWIEREHLDQRLDFPAGLRALRVNAGHDTLGIVTGISLVNATASIMALGLDPRFDLRQAYWLVDGIAGVDPAMGTVGTASWASYVVNDEQRSIDSREAPASWPYGLFAIGATAPDTLPDNSHFDNDYTLNAGLARWAYELTRGLTLPDNETMQANRKLWQPAAGKYPRAVAPPTVIAGDTYSGDTYWHGQVLTDAARAWVKLWTHGHGTFAMTDMEDAGFVEALRRLTALKKADVQRLMVLRVGSNFCLPAPGRTAFESVTTPYLRSTALENAWLVGSTVVHELQKNWATYGRSVPEK